MARPGTRASFDDQDLVSHGGAGAGDGRGGAKAGRELLAGADVLAFLDIDSTQKRVYGRHKEGAKFGGGAFLR